MRTWGRLEENVDVRVEVTYLALLVEYEESLK